jgi:hypothetical protein
LEVKEKDFKKYNVNNLEKIGWVDKTRETPLPMMMWEDMGLVYHKSRYVEDYVPPIVFIPNKKIMFTIMISCIGC